MKRKKNREIFNEYLKDKWEEGKGLTRPLSSNEICDLVVRRVRYRISAQEYINEIEERLLAKMIVTGQTTDELDYRLNQTNLQLLIDRKREGERITIPEYINELIYKNDYYKFI